MVQQHQQELKKQLWNIANSLRGNMSADDFRDYILGLIFYKYLSDLKALPLLVAGHTLDANITMP